VVKGKPRTRRKKKYYNYTGNYPTEQVFIENYSNTFSVPYHDAYNIVMDVMRIVQDMFLTHRRFMLPGIGVVGIAENVKRGIVLASSSLWWTPGLVNVLARAPGWENAPLNTYFSRENINSLNSLYADLASRDKILFSPKQYYDASDFGVEGEATSDQKLAYYAKKQAETDKKREKRARFAVDVLKEGYRTREGFKVAWLKLRVKLLERQLTDNNIEFYDSTTLEEAVSKELDDKV